MLGATAAAEVLSGEGLGKGEAVEFVFGGEEADEFVFGEFPEAEAGEASEVQARDC